MLSAREPGLHLLEPQFVQARENMFFEFEHHG